MKADSLFNSKVRAGWQFLSFMCSSAFLMMFWEETRLRGCQQQQCVCVRQCGWCFGAKLHRSGCLLGCLAHRCIRGKVGVQLPTLLGRLQLYHKAPGVNVFSSGEGLCGVVLLLYVPLHEGFWQEAAFVLDTFVPVTGTAVPGGVWAADRVL